MKIWSQMGVVYPPETATETDVQPKELTDSCTPILHLTTSIHIYTPGPLYNTLHNNTVLNSFEYNTDHCWIPNGLSLLDVYTVYSRYNTYWIANTKIGLDPQQ